MKPPIDFLDIVGKRFGLPLTLDALKNKYSGRSASLDRIDNSKGYVLGNIQWLHKDVNWMKGRFSQAKFIELCCAVSKQVGQGINHDV